MELAYLRIMRDAVDPGLLPYEQAIEDRMKLYQAKRKEKKDTVRRIPEKTLFLFVLLGGGIGGTAGMFVFRHKTKHWYFKLGFPAITVLEYAGLVWLLIKFWSYLI